MNTRSLAWKIGGIAMGLFLVALSVRGGGMPAWNAFQSSRSERDSLQSHLAKALSPHLDSMEPSVSATDFAAPLRSSADQAGVELHALETTRSGTNLGIHLQAKGAFPQLVGWVGRLESPAIPCRIQSWSLRTLDPRGGPVMAQFELECRSD